ncbi:hypothetical protein C8Q75DRAFT_801983 [Abortiporus biennis]|nr:hypothetical protein C8Q75DRAFT_801983 [Abortiporus biennis]
MSTSSQPPSRSPSPPAFSSKFEAVVVAQRRSPPTALRLYTGPLPPRSKPKHTLPSIPRPAFDPKAHERQGPIPRRRVKPVQHVPYTQPAAFGHYGVQPIVTMPSESYAQSAGAGAGAVSERRSSLDNAAPITKMRAPWNHSSGLRVPFDVASVLKPPTPAVVCIPAYQ